MSNIAEILMKAESIQRKSNYLVEEDSNEQYRLGRMCYCIKDFDGAEFWWEKAARNHNKLAKQALLELYDKELKYKNYSTPRPTYSEVKGRKWPISTGRYDQYLYVRNL